MSSNLCTPRMVLIAEEELERLRKIEADLQAMLEAAKKEEHKNVITRLYQRDKESSGAAEKYGNEINAKHLEAKLVKTG
jgi:hypothetical protein